MTIEEAIERYTSNAEYERTHGSLQGCLEFRQLAEWLKDYKRLLEQEPKTGHWIERRSRATGHIESVCSECGAEEGYPYNDYCGNCGAKMFEPQESEVEKNEET